MNFVLQTPSLQHVAGIKIITHLWNQPDIFIQIAEFFNNFPAFEPEIEEKVKSKVWALQLPQIIRKELLNFIKPIGMEIIAWCSYHNLNGNSLQFYGILLPRQFCWSMSGTIDYAATAELMVKDERLSVEKRFEFACLNCLEDEARKLIQLIPKQRKHKYITEMVLYRTMDYSILIAYFACTLSGDVDLLDRLSHAMDLRGACSVNKRLFQAVLNNGPRATCAYFSQKVSQAENEKVYSSLLRRPRPSPTCGLMYWLSPINEEHNVFRGCIAYQLTQLLRWPMQPLFMERTTRAWQLMDIEDCAGVLDGVIRKINHGFRDYDYAQWFWELWRSSSAEHKQYFLDDFCQLVDLIATKRKEFILLVFEKAPSHLLKELHVVEETYTYERVSAVLMDESVISESALVECKQTAIFNSSNEPEDEEKRMRSQHVVRLVDLVMESRIKPLQRKGRINNLVIDYYW